MIGSVAARQLYVDYVEMSDEEIVELAQLGNQFAIEFLVDKYKNFVRAKARAYFLIGADREDIIQEGMIGLFKAIRDYNGEKLTSFRAFAEYALPGKLSLQ
jgi:RNA polymerase sporulation-specific sigma factor